MKYLFVPVWGVPCCDQFSSLDLRNLWSQVPGLFGSQSAMQANLLMVVGQITHKQAPYLQNLWAQLAYPAYCVHFTGCRSQVRNYAVLYDLSAIIDINCVVETCDLSSISIERALRSLKAGVNS